MIFHKSIGFPEELIVPDKVLFLKYSMHALVRLKERAGSKKKPLKQVVLTIRKLVEVWTTANRKNITTCMIRIQYDKKHDIILVLKPNFKKKTAKVITLWINHKKDQHKFLDKSKYDTP